MLFRGVTRRKPVLVLAYSVLQLIWIIMVGVVLSVLLVANVWVTVKGEEGIGLVGKCST